MPLETVRLTLEPLRVDHAEEMTPLLADPELYVFTGGGPPTLDELRARYGRQATGRSPDGVESWLNWIVRRREDGQAVGFVQAAISPDPPPPAPVTAVLAWVLGVRFQAQGYAREAADALVAWLQGVGVQRVVAHIDAENAASMGVARALGLDPTAERVDGEVVWERLTGSG
ncbi:MAG TPA: GNAT family N-acetyltransferase [Solirubrobacteraceae bacterium]|nr:GNAT family N-acetyltransferase [Solirubrobacteraceae bacterium]